MVPPSAIPYVIFGGTMLIALLVPLLLDSDLWYVPVVTLPFGILYLLVDRKLAQDEKEGSGGH